MEFTYKKHDNEHLFSSLAKNKLGLHKLQNYIPLYSLFFALTDSNWDSINLNNAYYLNSIKSKETDNIVDGLLKHVDAKHLDTKEKLTKKVFFKYSPLLDPLKYLTGKYNTEDPTLLNLPSFTNNESSHEKTRDINNSAYIDSFFSYLTSKLLHTHNFINGIDFYGSFLSIKENYPVNIYDDIEYVDDFDFFHKNKDILFTVDEAYSAMTGNNTRNYKQKIIVSDKEELLQLSDINDLEQLCVNINSCNVVTCNTDTCNTDTCNTDTCNTHTCNTHTCNTHTCNADSGPDVIYETSEVPSGVKSPGSKHSCCSTSSSCSSRSSCSDKENDDNCSENDNGSDSGDDSGDDSACDNESISSSSNSNNSDYSSICGEEVFVKIKAFPVQTIALECCEDTLNSLVEDEEHPLKDAEWDAIVLQVLMSLITYQNAFGLTHNDLHSNNIMYTETDKQFIYYKVDGAYYKVPTFGRLFKIIDFGRAIYKFKGQLLCSDSFHPKGDAATQYNFPPYFNPGKPIVEPNFSFDLCRLGCSIYDCLVEDVSVEHEITSPILKIILAWCKDDKGRNIIYKKNGEERYPDFKLYKMISRKVHNNVPIHVLRNKHFDKYKIQKKKITKDKVVINIDDIPCYM